MMRLRGHAVSIALAIAAVGALGIVFEALRDPGRALLAWVAAYGFGLGTALGALVLVMVFHVAGARWPLVLMPRIMAVTSALPIFAVLFLPIVLGLRHVYPWAGAALPTEADGLSPEVLAHQRTWNNPTFFIARALLYLASWCFLAMLLRRTHEAHRRAPSARTVGRQRRISGAGLPIVALTLTFAAFDWFMSVQPGWISDIYGVYFFCGGLMSAVSLVAILAWGGRAPLGPSHFHAVGRLMLMSVVLWAYAGFFQLLLMWIADLPREVSFYVARSRGSFVAFDALLLFGHFVVPFLALLSRPLKRNPAALALIGAWLVLMDAADVAWLVLPARGDGVRLLDLAPFLTVGGIAFAYGAHRFAALGDLDVELASRDPAFAESLRYRSS
jgi:hypothetical protein